ncbi:coenzyme F420-0:L-glutamate ligase [Nocardioides yefusunii]|uniref:Coenzyme F420-0:L-glutamate ligase n=1 Tax=Nocardioides yefusunii TaxID=2500546 RepID=A0ABW1QYC2_9ACTN|nr:coenzyme F420-0:L-glutamate ligase [Nocardioides yefusunii]
MTARSGEITVTAPDGLGEIVPGTDLAVVVADLMDLMDGDVVVVTSKIVSKAEGRIRPSDDASYEQAFADETIRVVARRGMTRIVRNRLGLVMAAAGIDRSNVEAGTIVLLPADPDATARTLRERLAELAGVNVGVVVTDTAGRAWRDGQTDIAIGVAGLTPAEVFAGSVDSYGNPLAVTLPAVADEIAGAAELAQGKLGGRPLARVRGRADLVLPRGDHGPGAVSLQRGEGADLFGFGAREAVVTALATDETWWHVFGAAAASEEFTTALRRVFPDLQTTRLEEDLVEVQLAAPAPASVLRAVAVSHGWRPVEATPEAALVTSACFSPTRP